MDILYYVLNAVSIVIVTTLFEYIKALVSTVQGDVKPKNMGKLTLNPVKHFEPIGFLLFLFTGYGWANPIETSSLNYKDRKKGTIITYITPMILAVILAVVFKVIMNFTTISGINGYVNLFFAFLAKNFAAIAVFNIIPIYPLNGSWILRCLLNPNQAIKYSQYEKPLQILVVFLLILGWLTPLLDIIVSFIV